MDLEIPPDVSIKKALEMSHTKNCIRYSYYFSENQHHSKEDAIGMSKKLYATIMEPWQSIPDVEAMPQDILYVAKHAVWQHMERARDEMVDGVPDDFNDLLSMYKKINENGRKLYDDILAFWNNRPE